jgi:DNA-binding transcriptional LysR family regulator
VDLRHLRVFLAVAETGTVAAGAERAELSRATVSEQVRALESALGVALFQRRRDGMVLTERGRRLVPAARQLLDHADAVRRLVTDAPSTVRVGTLETLLATRLPAVIARLADRRPDLRLDAVAMMRGPLLRAVATGELDAALLLDVGTSLGELGFGDQGEGLEFVDIGTVRLHLVAGQGHRLATAGRLAPADLADELVLVTPPGCSFRMATDRVLGPAGRRTEFTSVSTVKAWAGQGLGVALLPDFAVTGELTDGTLVSLPLHGPPVELALRVVWRAADEGRELRDALYAIAS